MAQKLWKSLKFKDEKIVSDYDKSEWIVGEYRKNPYPVKKECEGLNCSMHIVDAMGYVNCGVLAEVKIRGTAITGNTKITAQEMKIVKAWRWTKIDSVEMAIYAAELVIDHYEKDYPNDSRPRQAIEAAKAYLKDPTTANAAAHDAAAAAHAAAYAAHDAAAAAYAAAYAAHAAAAAAYAAYAAHAAADAAHAAAAAAHAAAYAAADAAYAAADAAHAAAYAAADAAHAAAAAAYAAHAAAAAAADAAAASKKDREKAREEMKTKIDKWVISHLKNCEQVH
jgi:transcription termination factor NusB